MSRRQKLSDYDLAIIAEHLEPLILAAQKQIDRLQSLPMKSRPSYFRRQLEYWKDYRASMRSALSIARQRTKKVENVN